MRKKDLEDFGAYLKKKRIASGLSQGKVARALGYESPQYISNYERGLCSPPMNKLKELSDLYHIPKRELLEILMEFQKKFFLEQLGYKSSTGFKPHSKALGI